MIYTKLISGLGNQLFQYAIGRQLSLMNNTELKLDVSFFKDQQLRSYKLDNYKIDAEQSSYDEVKDVLHLYNSNSFYAKIYRKAQARLPKYKRSYFKEDNWWSYEPDLFRIRGNAYIEGYWQHSAYFNSIAPCIYDEIQIAEAYPGDIDNLITKIEDSPCSVSIHFRRGDYITDTNANNLMGVLPVDYYQTAIQYLKLHFSDLEFFIFSDDLNWVASNLNFDFPTTFVDIYDGKKDYIELDLMRRCKHNIIANSSFSWWGGFLNRNPQKMVICPKQWVKPPNINKQIKIQLPNWIKI